MADAGGGAQGMAVAARVSMNSHGGGGGGGAATEAGYSVLGSGDSEFGSEGGIDNTLKANTTALLPAMKSIFSDDIASTLNNSTSRLKAYAGNVGDSALSMEPMTGGLGGFSSATSHGVGGLLTAKAGAFGTAKG